MIAPAPSYRQTFLRYADACPHSAWLYRHTEGATPSHPMMRGRAFHLFAERAVRAMIDHGEQTIAQADAKAILHEVLQDPELLVPAADVELLRLMVFHFAETFTLPSTEAQTETPVLVTVGATRVTGTIDLWWRDGDTVHLRDWKAGYGLIAQDDVSSTVREGHRGAKAFQLIIYALGWNASFDSRGVKHYDCRFVYPAFAGLVERDVQIHADDMIEHRLWLEGLISRMRDYEISDVWPAIPGSHCSTCPAPQRCPIPQDLRPVDDLDIYEDGPLAYALRAWQLEAELKRAKATLRAHVEQYGPIAVGKDLEWRLRPVTASRTNADAKARLQAGEHVAPGELFKEATATRFELGKVAA